MAEEKETKETEKSRDDAMSGFMDKMTSAVDALCSRMDAWEEKEKAKEDAARKDAEEKEKADAARKDEEEAKAKADAEEEEKAKEDKAKKDAEEEEKRKDDAARADSLDKAKIEEVLAKVNQVIGHISGSPETRAQFGEAQARADAAYRAHGKEAPAPMVAETLLDYRRRLLSGLQSHSKQWSKTDLKGLADNDVLANIERVIYDDAVAAARDPSLVAAGTLRRVVKRSDAGHTIHEYIGDPRDAMAPFVALPKIVQLRSPHRSA
jgi:chemotaxis protein histidine kinase CheA